MIPFKNFYTDLKPIAGSSTRAPIQESDDQPIVKIKPATSIIRMGDRPSAIVIAQEEPSNDGGSIEDTPENAVISDTHDPSPSVEGDKPQTFSPEEVLYEKWSRMLGIKEIR